LRKENEKYPRREKWETHDQELFWVIGSKQLKIDSLDVWMWKENLKGSFYRKINIQCVLQLYLVGENNRKY